MGNYKKILIDRRGLGGSIAGRSSSMGHFYEANPELKSILRKPRQRQEFFDRVKQYRSGGVTGGELLKVAKEWRGKTGKSISQKGDNKIYNYIKKQLLPGRTQAENISGIGNAAPVNVPSAPIVQNLHPVQANLSGKINSTSVASNFGRFGKNGKPASVNNGALPQNPGIAAAVNSDVRQRPGNFKIPGFISKYSNPNAKPLREVAKDVNLITSRQLNKGGEWTDLTEENQNTPGSTAAKSTRIRSLHDTMTKQ